MKFLTPEIEALSKFTQTKSLAKLGTSCGIFQDCNPNSKPSISYYNRKTARK
ncbi:hypothetical protein [Hyunsoonleella ulvae]|uniref:hypothetical protein n=1 Tax=Hyunsoonleella ulvae TaxID=2799948 RepID=UPI00193A677E|nr:hypothetical protein [Hyunsoonleella ulvae]